VNENELLAAILSQLKQLNSGGGGSSTPQLPQWTFQDALGGDPTAGKFTTDHAGIAATTSVKIHDTAKDTGTGWAIGPLIFNNALFVADALGNVTILRVQGATYDTIAQAAVLPVFPLGVTSGNWSGVYSVSFGNWTGAADGTVTPVTSITTQGGIITAIS